MTDRFTVFLHVLEDDFLNVLVRVLIFPNSFDHFRLDQVLEVALDSFC